VGTDGSEIVSSGKNGVSTIFSASGNNVGDYPIEYTYQVGRDIGPAYIQKPLRL